MILTVLTLVLALWIQTFSNEKVHFATGTVLGGNSAGLPGAIQMFRSVIGGNHEGFESKANSFGDQTIVDNLDIAKQSILTNEASFMLNLMSGSQIVNTSSYRLYATEWLSRMITQSTISSDWRLSCKLLSLLRMQPRVAPFESLHTIIDCIHSTQCHRYTPTSSRGKRFPAPLTMEVLRTQVTLYLQERFPNFVWHVGNVSYEDGTIASMVAIVGVPSDAIDTDLNEYFNPPHKHGIYVIILEYWYWVANHPYSVSSRSGETKTYDGPSKPLTHRMLRYIERSVDSLLSSHYR
jgi:hypothetical protein